MTEEKQKTKYTLHVPVVVLLIAAGLLGLFYLFRDNQQLMDLVIERITDPYKRAISAAVDAVPFSVGELLCIVVAVFAVVYLIRTVYLLICKTDRVRRFLRRLVIALAAVLIVYDGFTLLWGVNYYGTSFSEQAGLTRRGATTEELYALTAAFAERLNELSSQVERDEEQVFRPEMDEVFARSAGIYQGIAQEYPFLASEDRTPKKLLLSRLQSYMGFTGFFFPFTAEVNLNVDAPTCMLPATVAHELSHLRGVSDEDESNFVAVLTCLRSDDTMYQYSGCLLAYIHLSNALYRADSTLSAQVRGMLNNEVLLDLADNNEYWHALESTTTGQTVKNAAESAYNSFTSGYGEENVMARYEACVELLVAYYFD